MDNFLIAAYLLDGKGKGKAISIEEVNQWKPSLGYIWIHLNYDSEETKNWLREHAKLNEIMISALCADESRPRTMIEEKGLLICLRSVNHNPGNDPEDMVSIRVWIDKNRIISTRRRKLLSIDDIRRSLENGWGPKSPSHFLRVLNDRLTDRMSDVIESVNDQVDELENHILTEENACLRTDLADIRRQCILIRRYLSPQREALNRLTFEENDFVSKIDRAYLHESTDRVVRYIEDLDSSRDRATIIQEELSNKLSEQINHKMYALSVAAVIFLPLTFITGLLGVNVSGIPGSNYKWAFEIVCLAMAAITGGMLYIFKRKKWI